MTRIHLSIEAESTGELQSAINELARSGVRRDAYGPEDAPPNEPTPVEQPAPEQEQPKAEEPKKRKRRTKAEIEADKKAEAEAQRIADEKAGNEREAAFGDDSESQDAQPSAEVVELKQESEAPAEQPTRQDVDAAMRALLEANGGAQMLEILKELGAVNAEGQLKISALAEEHFATAIEKANAAAAGLKEKSDEAGSLLG